MVDKDKIRMEMRRWFAYYGSLTVDDHGLVSCEGSVQLTARLSKLPVKFHRIDDDFRLENTMTLKTLEGCPEYVGNLFSCMHNSIKSLLGAPKKVGGNVVLTGCKLTNLIGCPEMDQTLNVVNNPLTSLEGIPDHLIRLVVSYDPNLPLLRALAANTVELRTTNDTQQSGQTVEQILNKYTQQGKVGALKAAAELIRAGFKENARW